MSDNGLKTYEVQLATGSGTRAVRGDEWSTDAGYLRIWQDDVLVFEAAPNCWVYVRDMDSIGESKLGVRPIVVA